MSKLRSRFLAPLMAAATLVTACGNNDRREVPPGSTASAAESTDTVAAGPAAEVVEVVIGRGLKRDGLVAEPADSFGVRDTIYAVVRSRGAGHIDLKAVWRYEDGQVVTENARSIDPEGDANTEFHVVKATPWPPGDYAVEILADGRSVDMKQFQIR